MRGHCRSRLKEYLILLSPFLLLILMDLTGIPSFPADAAVTGVAQRTNPFLDADLSIRIFPSTPTTFGYDILLYGRPFIHQPSIPGLPGNEGFTTRERARKVAELVLEKIRRNEMPPSVTPEELNRLGVLK